MPPRSRISTSRASLRSCRRIRYPDRPRAATRAVPPSPAPMTAQIGWLMSRSLDAPQATLRRCADASGRRSGLVGQSHTQAHGNAERAADATVLGCFAKSRQLSIVESAVQDQLRVDRHEAPLSLRRAKPGHETLERPLFSL